MAKGALLLVLSLALLALVMGAASTAADTLDAFPPLIPGLTPLSTVGASQFLPDRPAAPVQTVQGSVPGGEAGYGLDWLTDATSLVARGGVASAVYWERYIVIIGGRGADPVVYSPEVEVFDALTGEWRLGSPLPNVRFGLPPGRIGGPPSIGIAAAVWGVWLHAIGGDDALLGEASSWYHCKYHIPTDTWLEFDCPFRRTFGAATAWEGWVFYLGGRDFSGPALSDGFAYDTLHHQWYCIAPMLSARYGGAAVTFEDRIYVGGGKPDIDRFERWDPDTNKWTGLQPMPHGRYYFALVAAEGYLYAVGGQDLGGVVSDVDRYDPRTNTWETVGKMRTPRRGIAGGLANGRLYAIEGAHGAYPIVYVHRDNEYVQLVEITPTPTPTCSPGPTSTPTHTRTPTRTSTPTATVQEVRFRGTATEQLGLGCMDCYYGWAVRVEEVLSGPFISGEWAVITGGGLAGCSGGYADESIRPRDQVEVYAQLLREQGIAQVCNGSDDYYIRRATWIDRTYLPLIQKGSSWPTGAP